MTDADRARLVEIVAHATSRGKSPAEVERLLGEYMSDLDPSEFNRAMNAGEAAVAMARAVNRGDITAPEYMAYFRDELGAANVRALYRVRTGPGPNDWAGGAVNVSAGMSVAGLLGEAEKDARAVLKRILEHDSDRYRGTAAVEGIGVSSGPGGSVELVYVTPL